MGLRGRLWLSSLMVVALVALQVPSYVLPIARTASAAQGDVISWTSRANMPDAHWGPTAVAVSGHHYVIGGAGFTVNPSGGGAVTDSTAEVLVAPIAADGSLGAYAATSAMGTPRALASSIAHGGFLYVIGGFTGGNSNNNWTAVDTIERAAINANGTLGTWSTLPTRLTSARGSLGVFSPAGGRLYVVGGAGAFTSSGAIATVESIDWTTLDGGAAGAWRAESPLPAPRAEAGTVGIGPGALVTGGFDGSQQVTKTIYRATLDASGAVTWDTLATQMNVTSGIGAHGAAYDNGFLYVTGGVGNTTNHISWIHVNGDLTLSGSWNDFSGFATTSNAPMVAYGLHLYYVPHNFAADNSLDITLEGLPDLRVTSFTAPAVVVAGGRATYSWTITNIGTATAVAVLPPSAPPYIWGDQVWLSTSPTAIGNAQGAGGTVAQKSLAPGESYTTTFAASVPNVGAGNYYFVLQTDAGQQVAESDETNNLFAVATRVINGIAGTAECRYINGDTITTIPLPGATVDLLSGSALLASTTADANATYSFEALAPFSTYTLRYTKAIFLLLDGPPTLSTGGATSAITCEVSVTTDANGTGIVPEPTPLLDRLNHLWFRPYHLQPGVPTVDVIPTPGVSTWYRVTVQPHQRLTFRLTNPPTQYTVLAFTDLFKEARDLLAQGGTLTALRMLDATQDRSAPDLDSPDLDSPDLDSPDLDSPDLDSPDLDSPDLDSPDLDSPDLDSPDLDSPDLDSPDLDSPDLDSGGNPVPAAQEVVTFGSVYVAAQRHGLRAFSAHPGTVPQTIVMNTRDYQGDVYFRVRPHGDLSSSDTFTVTATTEGGAGCTLAPLVVRAPSNAAPSGTYKTLVLTNTAGAWFTGQNAISKASFLTGPGSLAAFAARPEVNGVVVDLANDANLQATFADWAANPTCVAQANIVALSLKQLVDQARAHGIEYVVIAGADPAVPFFRTRDDAELSKESRYSGGLDALSPLETALTEDYVLTDSFYGAHGPTTRSGHDFYLSDLAIGRLVETPSDILSYLAKYNAASGGTGVQRAFSSGYGFVSDLASYETNAFHNAGATVDTLNNDTWSSDDLRGFLFGAQHYQVLSLQGHGRADRLVPADDGARLLSSEVAAVNDGRFAGTFVMSLACHYTGYDLVQSQQLPGTPVVSFPSAFIAQGATSVGETGFGYGHDPLLKNGEVVMADLADELSYTGDLNGNLWGPRGVPVGKALNIAKLRFLNSLADVRGIEAKVINETVVYGAPMFAVKMPNPGARPATTSIVGALGSLSGTLSSADVSQTFTLHPHTLGAGTFFDAGTLNDTATFAFRPIVPSRIVGIQASAPGGGDALPRGAVFLSGTYTDTPGFVPALAIPATQDGTTNPPTAYTSTSFAPSRLIRLDEFAGDEAVFVPFQFQGNGASGTARTFGNITAKLYYSTLTGDAALVDAPSFQNVSITRDLDGSGQPTGLVRVNVTLSSRLVPDIQDVWETYTGTSAPLRGTWQSAHLTGGITIPGRGGTFTRTYTGTIDPQGADPTSVLVDIQAVGGNGLVSYATNGGQHYQIVDETATKGSPKRTPLITISAPSSATYRQRIPVSATLSTLGTGAPIANKKVTFKLGGSYASAMTNASGLAIAALVANVPPDPAAYHIVASVSEDLDMLAGGVEASITVGPGPTQIAPLAGTTFDCATGAVIGKLTLVSRNTALTDERVTIDIGGGRRTATYTDRNGGIRFDAADFGKLAPGMYSAALGYAGQNLAHPELSRFAASSSTASLKVTEKSVVTVGASPQPASAPVNFGGAIQQGAAIAPNCLPGDITKALVHYVVTSENGATVATGDAPVTANTDGSGNGTWSASVTLPAGVYDITSNAAGFYTSATATALLAVFDPSTFVTGGGYVLTSATNSTGLVIGKKANFGFNLKYQTGTTIPTGSFLFQAKESNVDFKATSFDWMVITTVTGGKRAEYQGTGTVNGVSGWQFHAVATDGGAVDTFEIRLTNAATGASYFLSGMISGGNIVIH